MRWWFSGREFEPVEDDVEVAAFERGNELVPLVLHHLGFHAQLRREGVGQVVFEADQSLRLFRIREDVRRAALRIGAPEQHAAALNDGQGIRRKNRPVPAPEQENETQTGDKRPAPEITH